MENEMKPGRELDALVAEKVMGLRKVPDHKSIELAPQSAENFKPSGYYGPFYDNANPLTGVFTWRGILPAYSTDIAAAWEVVKHFCIPFVPLYEGDVGSDIRISAIIRMEDGRWMARFDDPCGNSEGYYERSAYNDKSSSFVIADTAPHAICLAALRAVESSSI